MERARCHDCGALEGELHDFGCDCEICPFCGNQLLSCDCCYEKLGLFDGKYSETYYLPPAIYRHGLTSELEKSWLDILNKKGRIPWIQYPSICCRCGELWPDMFMVPNGEWTRYVQPDMRGEVLCRECYNFIKSVIDHAGEKNG